jgi:hypothetical protein
MQLPTQFLVHRQTTMYNGDLIEAINHSRLEINSPIRYKTCYQKPVFAPVAKFDGTIRQFPLFLLVAFALSLNQAFKSEDTHRSHRDYY